MEVSHHESVTMNENPMISRNQGSFKSNNVSLKPSLPQTRSNTISLPAERSNEWDSVDQNKFHSLKRDPSIGGGTLPSSSDNDDEVSQNTDSPQSVSPTQDHTPNSADTDQHHDAATSSENDSSSEKNDISNNKSSNNGPSRPPPPAMKIPSRPSRPFPPPPQARLLEARLAKKKPPPPRPTVIDTRSAVTSNGSVNTTTVGGSEGGSSINEEDSNTRNLKMMQLEMSTFSNIPKRPPPPTSTPSQTKLKECTEEANEDDEDVNNLEKIKDKPTATPGKDGQDTDDDDESADDQLEPLPSPQHDKKFVNKMKSGFRNLTQRKKRRDNNPSSSRRTIAGSNPSKRPVYDRQRYPEKLPVGILSPLVIQCIAYLNNHECLTEPGLFRIPGDMSVMKKYRASFAYGEEINLSECRDPHTVAGLLKLHFREQRQCVIPGEAIIHKIALAVEDRDVTEFKLLIESVDVESQAGIRMLAELLKKISENSDVNHMTSGTLATSCGPSFFPRLPPSSANAVLKFMTDNCDKIFGS